MFRRIGDIICSVVNRYKVSWVVSAGNHGPALCTVGAPPDISQPVLIGEPAPLLPLQPAAPAAPAAPALSYLLAGCIRVGFLLRSLPVAARDLGVC